MYGSRVNIKKSALEKLFRAQKVNYNVFSTGIKNRTRAIHSSLLSKLYGKKNDVSAKFRGCNTSFFKKDFVAVNGYNENIKGWGKEDSELALRFHNLGLRARRLRFRGIVFHIYHLEKSKRRLEMNNDIERKTKEKKLCWCQNGIDKYF